MRKTKWICLIILVCILLLISCDSDNSLSPPSNVPEDSTYNFAYEDSILMNSINSFGTTTIHIGSIDGSGIRSLCDSLLSFDGSWSSNKRKILFIGTLVNSNYTDLGLYQIDLNNRYRIKRIVPQETRVRNASYSPDMKYIAYSVSHAANGIKIRLYNVSTEEIIDVTDWLTQPIYGLSWSPDSKNILIDDGYLINIDSTGMNVLFAFIYGQIFMPVFSPDGSKVAFSGTTAASGWNIYIYDLNTKEKKLLYPQEHSQYIASWSKDGNQIIFDQRPAGIDAHHYLCKVDIDGSNFVQITDTTDNVWNPSWYK